MTPTDSDTRSRLALRFPVRLHTLRTHHRRSRGNSEFTGFSPELSRYPQETAIHPPFMHSEYTQLAHSRAWPSHRVHTSHTPREQFLRTVTTMALLAPADADIGSSCAVRERLLGERERAVLAVLVEHHGRVVDRSSLRHRAGLGDLSPRRCEAVLVTGPRRARSRRHRDGAPPRVDAAQRAGRDRRRDPSASIPADRARPARGRPIRRSGATAARPAGRRRRRQARRRGLRAVGVPAVLGEIVAGVVIGPSVLGLVELGGAPRRQPRHDRRDRRAAPARAGGDGDGPRRARPGRPGGDAGRPRRRRRAVRAR